MSFQKPPKLFIAYAHEDESFKNELTKRLEPLKRKNEIEVWHDGKLKPGDKWRDVRDRYLYNTDVVLYLTSPYSLASVECNKEIGNALGDQKRFVPIILRECDWKNYKVGGSPITDFPALPKDGKPIKSWEDKDEAWQNVINGIHKILDSAEEQEDTHQSTLFELGNAKYMLGALDEARAAYTKTIELKPDFAEAYAGRGVLFSQLKQYDKAEADYNKAIELKPDFAEAYAGRGVLFNQLKQYDKAEVDFTTAIELEPGHARAYVNRGNLFYNIKQYDKTEADYNKAIELEPDYVEAYNNRGVLFSQLKQYDKAEANYTKAIELEPDYAEAYAGCGALFSQLKQYDKAEANYTKAIELEPDFAEAYAGRGNLFYNLKQYDKAEANYTKAIELKPDFARTYAGRGALFSQLKQYDKAEADYNKAIELKPDFAEAYAGCGALFSQLKQYDKAEANYTKAIELEPDYAEAYAGCGALFSQLKQYDKAEANYTKAIELKPDFAEAYAGRGVLFSQLKQYDKAEANYTKAIELKPNYTDAHHNRAISMAKKDAEETQKKYKEKIGEILGPIKSLTYHTERINEREKNYKKKLMWLDIFIVLNIALILSTMIPIGYYLLNVTEIQSPFTITAIVFAALAMALPLLWSLHNLFERRRVLQICIEDYWRKQMLTSLVLLMENSDMKQYLVIKTHWHFMNNSAADLLSDLLAPRNSKKTQHKEMGPLDMDEFTKIMKQVVNRENK